MPTILLIDDNPGMLEAIRDAVPECHVVHAADGLVGLDMFRAQPESFDLILLDNSMPNLEGPDTLIKLREISKTVPIRLFTGYYDRLMFKLIDELSGMEPLMKGLRSQELAREIRASIGTTPIIRPGEAVYIYAQSRAGDREAMGRATQGQHVCVLAEARAIQGSIRLLLEAAGVNVSFLFRIDELRDMAPNQRLLAAVSPAIFPGILDIPVPILCLGFTLQDTLNALDNAHRASGAVAFVVDHPLRPQQVSERIQAAVQCLERGVNYRVDQLEHPFHPLTSLTLPDKDYLELEARGLTPDEIADRLQIEVVSIRTTRRRVRQRLGLDTDASLQDWAERWWFTRYLASPSSSTP